MDNEEKQTNSGGSDISHGDAVDTKMAVEGSMKEDATMGKSTRNNDVSEANAPSNSKRKWWVIIVAVLLIGIIIVYLNPGGILDKVIPEGGFNILPTRSAGAAVALVNGEELFRNELNARVSQARSILESQGAVFENDEQEKELESLSLDNLINETLIIQEAIKQGIGVGDGLIEEQYLAMADQAGGEEQLLRELQENDITEIFFRENIEKQLILRAYIDQTTSDIKISENDIISYYEELEGQGIELPAIEDIRDNLSFDIRQRRVADLLVPIINNLRAEADIEIKL